MDKLSDNYYFRKCFLEEEHVPTQSIMKKTMSPPLAAVYFKSMSPDLKVLAGLAPPLKGGGNDTWYQPPQEILNGRSVLKPVKKVQYNKLSCDGITTFSDNLNQFVQKQRQELTMRRLEENENEWKLKVDKVCRDQWEECAKGAAENNTIQIVQAYEALEIMYRSSINKIEEMLMAAATSKVKLLRAELYSKMSKHFEILLKAQATMLQDRYAEKISKEKARLKAEFIQKVNESRTDMSNQIHDLRVDKRVIIEKLRQLLQSQNMACQVYVALKEREECAKEIKLSEHEHKKEVKKLKEQLAMKDFEVRLEQEKEKKRLEFIKIWKKKMCHVVKKFQMFVMFCLNAMPEHAEFFINMEKLMMLQLSEAVDNPSAKSIIEYEDETFHTPVPRPHPFYLCCNKGYKPELDQDLCPEHCTSSASQMPVVIVNKRCIYAACDNFNMFTDKIQQFIQGQRGDDADFTDDHEYKHDVPVKMTSSLQLLELKLESSLLQVLQDELPNLTNVSVECCGCCKKPYCFCSLRQTSRVSLIPHRQKSKRSFSKAKTSPGMMLSREEELQHEREPKWESYMNYVLPTKCKKHCAKAAKHHLEEHLPPYMRNMSKFDKPDIPHYETCDVGTLKRLVKKAQGTKTSPPVQPTLSKVREVGTQFSDQEVDFLCNCFSNLEVERIMNELTLDASDEQFRVVGSGESTSYLKKRTSSFATECAFTLLKAFDDSNELKEIFKKDCLDKARPGNSRE